VSTRLNRAVSPPITARLQKLHRRQFVAEAHPLHRGAQGKEAQGVWPKAVDSGCGGHQHSNEASKAQGKEETMSGELGGPHPDGLIQCPYCKQEIDPEVCWCGDLIKGHGYDGHSPVPMGCDCGRVKLSDVQEEPFPKEP
jgi:hypothetical protein